MYEIVGKEDLNKEDYYIEVNAPLVARKWKPGQFVIFMTHPRGERVPMSVAIVNGPNIGMFIKKLGKTSIQLYKEFRVGDRLFAVAGPLGKPVELKKYNRVILASDAVCGHAEQIGLAEHLRKLGSSIISIQTFKTSSDIYPSKFLPVKYVDEHYITTLDGSAGFRGHYIDLVKKIVSEKNVDAIFAGGSLESLKKLVSALRGYDIPVYALTRQIMVDGTGMCGSCRVIYKGRIVFACREGPWFDARFIDWDDVIRRSNRFRDLEKFAVERYLSTRV
ncbi:sulfide/dihydroorotate dehydrogenase-like FAD/NAD-binding protein [Thermogladius sp. 4427co]|uniref:sulfide/dihydroorotate dehydrogenase-like FAD/NAD-binding protein n=1 Tax=Thermogladius sp. 4427co TaxID=3450718 RepID=UPI003F7AED7C